MMIRDLTVKKCKTCSKEFEGVEREYCSWQCYEKHTEKLGKRPDDAVKNGK
jgi:hypothetical protein